MSCGLLAKKIANRGEPAGRYFVLARPFGAHSRYHLNVFRLGLGRQPHLMISKHFIIIYLQKI